MALKEKIDLKTLSAKFDCFFIDQFGVLHDGENPYDGAVEALSFLKQQGKLILLLSNSGKRSEKNIQRIFDLGFLKNSFDHFLTSGEVAFNLLKEKKRSSKLAPHAKCLFLGRDEDHSALDGLGFEVVKTADHADFVIIAGSQGDSIELENYKRLLRPAALRKLPCFCTNPDKHMLTKKGICFGAGTIAKTYEAMGGDVIWIGKPYGEIYKAAIDLCNQIDPNRICCIGDSIEHDIVGGANANCKTALVRSGILAEKSEDELDQFYQDFNAEPNFILPRFSL